MRKASKIDLSSTYVLTSMPLTKLTPKTRHLLLQGSPHAFTLIHDSYSRRSTALNPDFFVQKDQKSGGCYLTFGQGKRDGNRKGHIGVRDSYADEKEHFQGAGIESGIELNNEIRAKSPGPMALLIIHPRCLLQNTLYRDSIGIALVLESSPSYHLRARFNDGQKSNENVALIAGSEWYEVVILLLTDVQQLVRILVPCWPGLGRTGCK